MSKPDPAIQACVEQTRSAVLNVLVVVGIGIAVSGWLLGRSGIGATFWPADAARALAHLALVGIVMASILTRLIGTSAFVLANPNRRASRFWWTHVLSAAIGALAIPLGFAYSWAIRPQLDAVGPFWIAALVLGVLALPRADLLEGFKEPMPPPQFPKQPKD